MPYSPAVVKKPRFLFAYNVWSGGVQDVLNDERYQDYRVFQIIFREHRDQFDYVSHNYDIVFERVN